MIDSNMCFRQGDVSNHGPNNTEGDLEQVGYSVYNKDVDEQIIHEVAIYSLR